MDIQVKLGHLSPHLQVLGVARDPRCSASHAGREDGQVAWTPLLRVDNTEQQGQRLEEHLRTKACTGISLSVR